MEGKPMMNFQRQANYRERMREEEKRKRKSEKDRERYLAKKAAEESERGKGKKGEKKRGGEESTAPTWKGDLNFSEWDQYHCLLGKKFPKTH